MTPLAPALGRLGAPPRDGVRDPIRLALVDALVTAHGEGRLDGAAWLEAWMTAAMALRDAVTSEARTRLERAAVESRYPADLLRAELPDAAAADRLLQRLLAEGMPLEQLEGEVASPELTRRRGAALESAWEAAVQIANAESARYRALAARIAAWRRPWRRLAIAAGVATVLALVVAAWIGGYLQAPGWFTPVVDWFWGLPWP